MDANVVTEYSIPAEHAMITNDYGNSCGTNATPYINNCGYHGAFEMMKVLTGNPDLNEPVPAVDSNLREFKQTGDFYAKSMDKKGWYYVPTGCQNGEECTIHVALHGCN